MTLITTTIFPTSPDTQITISKRSYPLSISSYFESDCSIAKFSKNVETTLEVIANRYIGANPRYDYTARPFYNGGIRRGRDYRYHADFSQIFPDAPLYSYVYAWGAFRAENDSGLLFTVIPKGPVKIYVNGETVYGTDIKAERSEDTPVTITLPIKKGWNDVILRFTRTPAGFGGVFGTWLGKASYYFFRGRVLSDLPRIEGFDYTTPQLTKVDNPCPETISPLCVPLPSWNDKETESGNFARIFDIEKSSRKYAVCRTSVSSPVRQVCLFSGNASGKADIYASRGEGSGANSMLLRSNLNGPFSFEHSIEAGITQILII